jgi:biopolymer transport protein TolQ
MWQPLFIASVWVNFEQSNTAGKIIVLLLICTSISAWTVMVNKYLELSALRKTSKSQKKILFGLDSLCSIPVTHHTKLEATLAEVFHAGLIAYQSEVRLFGPPMTEISRNRCMKNIETAMARIIAEVCLRYERKMTFLGSVVTAAPFLGLLGTVWGVMDAFSGAAQGGPATLQQLAPGVSGALLTTVAALMVAIPSVVGYNWIVDFIRSMSVELENDASELAERFENEINLSTPKR